MKLKVNLYSYDGARHTVEAKTKIVGSDGTPMTLSVTRSGKNPSKARDRAVNKLKNLIADLEA